MVPFLSVFMLGMAVSFDGFGVGFAYGLRRLHIPFVSLLIICLSSSLSVFFSMQAGSFATRLFNPRVASLLGGIMLLGVGFLIIRQALRGTCGTAPDVQTPGNKGFSLLSCVLREPSLADFDSSGAITGKEAVVLGVALAMDAFGAGFGAAMMGFAPLTTAACVGIAKFLLLAGGLFLGRRYSRSSLGEQASVFSGMVLVVIGIAHLIK